MQTLLSYSLLLLAVLTVGSSTALAQPLHQTAESLEWRCIDSKSIVLGTVANFRIPEDQESKAHRPEFEFEIKVLETLKGKDQPTITFRHPYDRRLKEDLAKAKREKNSFLLFLDKSQKTVLKPDPYPGTFPIHNPEYRYNYISDGPQNILKFDAYVKKVRQVVADNAKLKTTKSFDFLYGNMFTLRVPLDQRYEQVAQNILQRKGPNQKATTHEGAKGMSAIQLLSHFQSPRNEKLLKQMLSDSTEAWTTSERTLTKTGYSVIKSYWVRKYAFDVLKQWKIDVEQPAYSVEVPGPKLPREEQEVVWALHEAGNCSMGFTEPRNDTFHLKELSVRLPWKKIPDLTPLSKLKHVYVNGSGEEKLDLSGIGSPTSVTYFKVSWAKLEDLGPLSGMTALETLTVPNGIFSDLSPLSKLTQLTELDINKCKQVTDLTPLATCPSLKHLSLSQTAVEDLSPLTNLTILERVYLDKNKVKDVRPLMGSSKLGYLQLTKGAEYQGLKELQQRYPKLRLYYTR